MPNDLRETVDAPPAVPPERRSFADLAGLSPAYFGLVMATGIVSLATELMGFPFVARAMFALNVAAYAVLWALTLLRAALYPRRLFADMIDHLRGGFTVFYWATATWWIPMLAILAVWRYVVKRFPLKYNPLYWGAVFPLGMYTVCTFEMVDAMGFGFLRMLPTVFFWIAIAAWSAAFVGLARDMARRARGHRKTVSADAP
jgi:tellurite resistance protein TehA-like permease